MLTASLIRFEHSRSHDFNNQQTTVVWNRNLPVPKFAVSRDATHINITTEALAVYYGNDDGQNYDLVIRVLTPSVLSPAPVWTPKLNSNNDSGNLFGTFHTLDTLSGMQNLNCSQLDMSAGSTNVIPYYPCVMGLISRSGWATWDDSRSPVFGDDDWVHPQLRGQCDINATRTACFPGVWSPTSPDACEAAGCCWDAQPITLNLYYSSQRHDHFTDASCVGCDGSGYVFVRHQGNVVQFSDDTTIPLNLFWNPTPSNGRGGSNVVSTTSPGAGYTFVRVQGYIFREGQQPANTHAVKLWVNHALLDYYTTMCAADEADAAASGFVFVSLLGYCFPYTSVPPLPSCFQRSGNVDLYFFGHGKRYMDALADYALIAGRIPIPRKHFLGMSWSKWGNSLTQDVTYHQVLALQNASIPLDTYIFDMNWHLKPQWTGWTWDPVQYPAHKDLLAWLHDRALATGANLHDAQGVMWMEAQYAAMARANGIDPTTSDAVPFNIANKTYSDTLHDIVLAPLAEEGLDFWWTDFQQGLPGVADVTGLTPTWLLNHVRFMGNSSSSRRGLIHSRFGGMGSHR